MADPYIDQRETLIYGAFACDQMDAVCLGRIPALDATVCFAIDQQTAANAAMKLVLDRQPRPASAAPVDANAAQADARDIIVRFGSHLDSLKGRPVDPRLFFGHDAPSVLGRRRLTKLVPALQHIVDELGCHQALIRDSAMWLAELTEVHERLTVLARQQRAARVEKVDLAPDVAAARLAWLVIYNANKLLIRGLLAHLGKPELLPLIFDDLAEVHRTTGVSDQDGPPVVGDVPASLAE